MSNPTLMTGGSLFPSRVNRRQFLVGTAIVVGGAAVFGAEQPVNGGLAALLDEPGRRLSVGFVEASAGAASLAAALGEFGGRVLPASSLSAGGLVHETLSVTVHGLSPGIAGIADSLPFVFVDALLPSPDPLAADATVPFYAWTRRAGTNVAESGRSRFVVAPARDLRLGIRVTEADSATTVFTSGPQLGLPQVQPGYYLVGLGATDWSQPTEVPAVTDAAWATRASIVLSIAA